MFSGSMVALVTPMHENGALDDDSLHKLVEFHINQGSDAIVAMGTTGESATLNVDEHCGVIDKVVKQVNGRIPVIAGTGANSTLEAIDLTARAKALNVDAALLVTPYYNRPTQEGMYQHFKAIAEAVDLPQILYNVPSRTASDLLPDTVGRLAKVDNIIGIKEATGDVTRVTQIKAVAGDEFELYSGDDGNTVEFIEAGGHGVISVTANVAPRLMHEVCAAAIAGKIDEAHAINSKLNELHRCLFLEANPMPVKWALFQMGMMATGIRLPLTVLSEQYHQAVRHALTIAGVVEPNQYG